MEGAKASTKKALLEATTRVDATEAKLGIPSIKKDQADQAFALKKITLANVEYALGQEKRWRECESSRLAAVKEEAKVEIQKDALAKALEYGMRF